MTKKITNHITFLSRNVDLLGNNTLLVIAMKSMACV